MLIFGALATHEQYMHRCLQLAEQGAGYTAPNPMVGAVLVHDDIIIGEGFHRQYGQPHAEVNCIKSVKKEHQPLIDKSTLYVSLEPCAHYGNTPPCADLIIANKIPKVVIGCRDSYKEVNGLGIKKLEAAAVQVTTGVLEKEARQLNKRFFIFHEQQRPYIILKWAQSSNGRIAKANFEAVKISNEFTNRLVHKWRSEEAAIMVGTNTALYDDPSLTTRYWQGNNPVRIVLDKQLKIPKSHHLFSGEVKTVVFNTIKNEVSGNMLYCKLDAKNIITQILHELHQMKVQSVLVEGGATLLQSFIDEGVWDEARIITNSKMLIENGIAAPNLHDGFLQKVELILSDNIQYYIPAL